MPAGAMRPDEHVTTPPPPAAITAQPPSVRPRVRPAVSETFRALQEDLDRFCWGGLLWGPWWALFNRVWIGLLAFVPVLGFFVAIVLGFKGRRWAWEKGRHADLAQFRRAQFWWGISSVVMIPALALVLAATSGHVVSTLEHLVGEDVEKNATRALSRLAEGLQQCAAAQGKLPPSSDWVPASLELVAAKRTVVPDAEWRQSEAFACSGFALSDGQSFQIRWLRDGSRIGKVTARADLTGDGQVDLQISAAVSCTPRGCRSAPPTREPVDALH